MFTSSRAPGRHPLFAVVASVAMVFAGLMLAASPAQAADVFITPAQLNTSETRATGHNVFVADGVRVYTEGNTSTDKAAGYFAVSQALASSGEPSMDADPNDLTTTLLPGMQLVTDFDNDGAVDGILVGEPTYANGSPLYGENWWLTNGSKQFVKDAAPTTGGGGSSFNGTLAQWRAAFPDAQVRLFGWSLGSGVKGDVTIHSMTLGSNTYRFRGTGAPVVVDVSATGPLNKQLRIATSAFDPEGGKLTYSVGPATNGFAHMSGNVIVFNPRNGYTGTTSFPYRAKDAKGLTGTGTVTVTITKASSTLKLAKQYASKGNVNLQVQILSAGLARGGTITVTEGGTTVATKVATAQTNAVIFPAANGSHTYDVTFGGSSQTLPSAGSITVNVP